MIGNAQIELKITEEADYSSFKEILESLDNGKKVLNIVYP